MASRAGLHIWVCAASVLIAMSPLLAIAQPTPSSTPSAALDVYGEPVLKVYGEPGEGRIHVETRGRRWKYPGIYWLPKNTPLVEFLKDAGLPRLTEVDIYDVSIWVERRGAKAFLGKFSLWQFQRGEVKVTPLILEDGDAVCLWDAEI
jgi:hypothetical protein